MALAGWIPWRWNFGSRSGSWPASDAVFPLPDPATPLEALGDLLPPDDLARLRQEVEQPQWSTLVVEHRLRSKQGELRWVANALAMERDEHGQPKQLEGLIVDIHDSVSGGPKLSRLQGEHERFRRIFEHAHDGMFICDPAGRCLEANPAGLRMLGYSLAELHGHTLPGLAVGEAELESRAPGQASAPLRQRRLRRKDGSELLVEQWAGALPNGDSLCITRAHEDRFRLEAQILLADRLVSLGTLAAGIAHEFNNPLSWILSNLNQARELVKAASGMPAEARAELGELVSESLEGANRIVSIVSDLKTYARSDGPTQVRVSVHRALERATKMLAVQAHYRGQLITSLGEVPDVRGSESLLTQVFVNLLLNAVQALPEGSPEKNVVEVRTSTDALGRVVVEIRDTGCGIPPEHLSHIFDPFFTTKPAGVGTGLGLSVVLNIVHQLGGTLEVSSTVGSGTSVTVLLPSLVVNAAPLPG